MGITQMKNIVSKLYAAIKRLEKEEGQDLVEYALLVALMAFGCAASMKSLASGINALFAHLVTTLSAA
jgi:pilus assembly protein Flp/PilA